MTVQPGGRWLGETRSIRSIGVARGMAPRVLRSPPGRGGAGVILAIGVEPCNDDAGRNPSASPVSSLLMSIWAIADLHLSHARPDPRERFAGRWRNHAEKIATAWRETVSRDDLVLLPGDLSMARNHRDLQPDLVWLDRLPGRKVLSPGNHDLWWNGVGRIRRLLRPSLLAVGGDALRVGDVIVCGARGAPVPVEDEPPTSETQTQALREIDHALASAQSLRSGAEPIFVLWHYPPFDPHGRPGPVVAPARSGWGLGVRLRPPAPRGPVVLRRSRRRRVDPLPLCRRRRHRIPPPADRPLTLLRSDSEMIRMC